MGELNERSVIAGGFRTRYWEISPPRPRATVLLVHEGAIGADAITTWGALAPLLGEDYRVLAPDLLGYGGTDKVVYLDRPPHAFRAAHLAAFCREVGVGPDGAHLVGHSLGGSLVLRDLAADPPALPARSGVSISGTGGPWRSASGVEQLGRFDGTREDVARLVGLMVDDGLPGLSTMVDARYANTRRPGHVEACLTSRLKHPTLPRPTADGTWPRALAGSRVPVLVIGGERDTLLEPGWTEHFEQCSPAVSVRRLDCKHAPNIDRPELIARLLVDFFTAADRTVDGAADRTADGSLASGSAASGSGDGGSGDGGERLPRLGPGDLSAQQREVYQSILDGPRQRDAGLCPVADPAGVLSRPYRAMLLSPAVGGALERVGVAVRYQGDLPAAVRELAILMVARHCRCPGEWRAHEELARLAGVPEETIQSLGRASPVVVGEQARIGYDFVHELLTADRVSADTFARGRSAWSDSGVFELVATVGYYQTIAGIINAFAPGVNAFDPGMNGAGPV